MTDARPALAVWLDGTRIAEVHDLADDRLGLTWSPDARARWGTGSRVMSHLLPIADKEAEPRRVTTFVEGLLPEGNARTNYALDVGVRPDDIFGLLRRYGRDTAGALVFLGAEEPAPVRLGSYQPIDEAGIAAKLRHADQHPPTDPAARGVDSLSLAGMQPKIGLHRTNAGWFACVDGAPSTWIVKLAHPAGSLAADVVDTEVLSLKLAVAVGLSVVDAEVHDFDGERAIVVSRYDRQIEPDGSVDRIHQEDMAQALGLNTADPERKFQRGRAFPSLTAMAEVLRAGGEEPDQLLSLVTFNWLIGNTDAHAKNYSVLRYPDGSVQLAPAYDVAMHLHHDRPRQLSALDVNGKSDLLAISVADLLAEGRSWRLSPLRAERAVSRTVRLLGSAIEELTPADLGAVPPRAVDVVRERVAQARAELPPPSPARVRKVASYPEEVDLPGWRAP